MTFSFYCEQWNKKHSEQYQLHLYFSIVMPWSFVTWWWFLMFTKSFFLFILIFLAISILFINLTAFINVISTFLFWHFHNNTSNSCHKSFQEPLFIYFGLLRSPWYMQTWYVWILGRIDSFSFLWEGIKEFSMYHNRKSLLNEAGSYISWLSRRRHRAMLSEHMGSCTSGNACGVGRPYALLWLTAP